MVRAGVIVAALLCAAPAAVAQGQRVLALDLNRIDPEGGGCRLTFVASNGLAPIGSLVVETVLFDRAGRVAQLTLFDFGALPQERRRVRQFDVPAVACADLGQVLVNGVSACDTDGPEPAACAAALSVTGSVDGVEVAQ